MMLYMDPSSVNWSLAVRDDNPNVPDAPLTSKDDGKGPYSASGVWGNPTVATRQKGRIVVEGIVKGIDIVALRSSDLPRRDSFPKRKGLICRW